MALTNGKGQLATSALLHDDVDVLIVFIHSLHPFEIGMLSAFTTFTPDLHRPLHC
jgi:hypothetical protein